MKPATVENCRFRHWRHEKQDCFESRKYNHWLYLLPIGTVSVLQDASALRFNLDTFLMCENSEDSFSLPVHTQTHKIRNVFKLPCLYIHDIGAKYR